MLPPSIKDGGSSGSSAVVHEQRASCFLCALKSTEHNTNSVSLSCCMVQLADACAMYCTLCLSCSTKHEASISLQLAWPILSLPLAAKSMKCPSGCSWLGQHCHCYIAELGVCSVFCIDRAYSFSIKASFNTNLLIGKHHVPMQLDGNS